MGLPATREDGSHRLPLARRKRLATSGNRFFRAQNRPLAIGGSILVIAALIVQLLPPVIRSSNVFNGIIAASLGLFALIGFLFLRTKFRLSFPAIVLGLIQIWIVATVFLGPSVFGLELKLGRNIWWPAFVMMPYLAAFVLVAIDPRWRERLVNFMLGVCLFTALIAVLQFIKFPGTTALSNLYVSLEDLKEFGLDKRSYGLSTHPFHLSAQCILGCGIVASKLLVRKLTGFEIAFYALLSSGLIVGQARTFYVVWVIVTVITIALLVRRHTPQAIFVVCLMTVIIGSVVAFFPKQLSYGLSGKNTISNGRMVQWNRADELSSQFPLTGIGPKETVFGSGRDRMGTGRWYSLYTESGYRMSRVSGGYVGFGLLLVLVGSILFLSARVALDRSVDLVRRQAAFAGFYYGIAIATGLYITNILENELITYYGMVLAGLIAPQMTEVFKSQRHRMSKHMERLSIARNRLKPDSP